MASFIPRFLRHLRDVVITAPSDGEALLYDISDGKWKNAAAGGSGDLSDAVILTPAASARNVIQPTAGTVIASIVKAHAAQSVDLMQWQKSDGTPLVAISESGNVTAVAITAKDGTSTPLYVTRDTNSGAFAAFETEDALYSVELGTPGVAIFGDGTQAMLDVSGPTKVGILKVLQGVEGVVHVDGLLVVNSIATPVDATFLASELGMWFDPTNGAAKVMFKGKTADGTVVTWTIPNGVVASQADLDADEEALAEHLADGSDAHDASVISVADVAGDYTATDVEGVLAEIAPQLGWTTVTKAADESVASSTTTQNDEELFFTAVSGAQYEFELVIIYGSPAGGATPDLKFDIGEDATARGGFFTHGMGASDTAALAAVLCNQTSVGFFGTATADRIGKIMGVYTGAGGTFRFRWAQNTSGINATIVRAGSLLRYRRIL